MVFHYWISIGQRRAALLLWRRGKDIQEPVRSEVAPKNKCDLGTVQLRSCYNHLRWPDCFEPVQQLCVDRDVDWFLVDNADVWNWNQKIPE